MQKGRMISALTYNKVSYVLGLLSEIILADRSEHYMNCLR